MKVAKIVAIVLGVFLLLAVVIGALALTPGIQTWAVRRAVAGQPGMKIEVGHVAAGFSAADIRELRVVKDGMVITAKGITANYSAWDYISRKKINADQVTVEELVVDLRASGAPANPGTTTSAKEAANPGKAAKSSSAGSAGAPDSFQGALAQAQLPFDIRVARVSAKGRALLPGDKVVVFDLQGAGIENGQRGRLEWKAEFTDPLKGAAVTTAQLAGTTGVHITADRRIDLVEVDADVSARGPKLPTDRIKLQAKAEQATAGGNESYTATVALARGNQVEPLLKSAAEFRKATSDFAGTWELAVRSEQLAAVLAGFGLPEIAANGNGRFAFKPATSAASASGELQGNLSRLEKLAPELAKIGAMHFRAGFDGGLADGTAQLSRLQLDVTGADGRKFAEIATAQRVGFTLADKRITLADPKAELARVSIQALPLAWAQPFLKGMTIDSGDLSLALAVEAEADGSRIRARALQPLVVRTVTIRSGEKKLVDQATLSANPRIDYSTTRVVAELADLKFSMPAGDAISGSVSADVTDLARTPAIAFTTQLQAKLVAAHKPYLPVDTGPLSITSHVQGRMAGDILQLAKLAATVNRDGGAMLAVVDLQQPITANLKAGTFTVPKPDATVARAKLGQVPLAWAEPFVAKSKFAGALAGATLDFSCRSVDDLTVNTFEPVLLRGIGATLDGKPMLQSVDVSANLTATKRKDVVAYEVRRLELKQGEMLLAGLAATGEANLGKKLTLAAKGNLEADAAALMNQPVLASFATLSRGKITTAFEVNLADAIQAKAVLAARGLVAKQNNQPLGDLEVSLNANLKADGSGTLVAPLTLTNGNRRSDIALDGVFGKTADQKSFLFNGKIASSQLFVDDFQPLAGVAPAGEKSAKSTAPT
ncbi:MAG TPA: hypothetical protein VM029_06210, partial [Opitutaceae bacterium]|nr:hypothetical protein [Opitutaceae bacterium]